MPDSRFPVAVTMRCTPLVNRWVSERWEPAAVIPLPADAIAPKLRPDAVPRVEARPGGEWVFAGYALELHRSEGEGYHLNLTAPDPRVFVMWRMLEPEQRREGEPPVRPFVVTVSYNEAARMLDGGEQVDSVPLAPEIRAWMEPFVAEHYKPEPKRKHRRRDPLQDDDTKPELDDALGRLRERSRGDGRE
jgi:hypothetical protein